MKIKEIKRKNKLLLRGAFFISYFLDWLSEVDEKYYGSDEVAGADDWIKEVEKDLDLENYKMDYPKAKNTKTIFNSKKNLCQKEKKK